MAARTSDPDEFLRASQSIDSLGPSIRLGILLEDRQGFRWFGNGRCALMFGREAELVSGTDGSFVETLEKIRHTTILPVVEMQAGLQWNQNFEATTLVLKAGLESQIYFGGGGWDFTNDDDDGGAQWAGDSGNFGMLGFIMSASMNY
ncbi:MAG: Lpg1974 family pore-forming outer membrane protein [Planctomycetota bacterium]|nr:Lpg1974 family pore-forming outer membrane protein [Planctomycetota bacterium]